MTYQAYYQEVYIPLVIDGCRVAELCCDVTLEQDDDTMICVDIRIHSDIIEGKPSTLLKFGDKDTEQIFEAIQKQACKQLAGQFYSELYSAREEFQL